MAVDHFHHDPAGTGIRRSSPAAVRNREPIAEVLRDWLPRSGLVLEIASGTGEHAVFFAAKFPELHWLPSDRDAGARESIAAWRVEAGLANLRAPVVLDSSCADWPVDRADAVLSINMAHISPWKASLGLIAGAARLLPAGAPLILYGPWRMDGIDTAPSNLAFDADLKRRNPEWGIRRVEDFAAPAGSKGFDFAAWRSMPANNLMLLFRLRG